MGRMTFLSPTNSNVNVNVKNIYRGRRMSSVRIGGAGGRRNVRLSRMQQRTEALMDISSGKIGR